MLDESLKLSSLFSMISRTPLLNLFGVSVF